MSKIEIAAWGSPFSHDVCSCAGEQPSNHMWTFDREASSGISVFMDYNVLGVHASNSKFNYLWLCESRAVTPSQTEYVKQNHLKLLEKYRKIFTHNRDLIALHENFCYVPPAANFTWIKDRRIHKKNKMISMVSSGKDFTESHRRRNSILNTIREKHKNIDFFGKYFNPFNKKEDVLIDYMFSITIENDSYSTYYTEKIMDCFATGTVPIYLGAPDIGSLFDTDGIIFLNGDFDPSSLSEQLYWSKKMAIQNNFNLCLKHKIADDILFAEIAVDVGL
jgi:hypothetical protein